MKITENRLKQAVRKVLSESGHMWLPATDSLLMLDKDGIEKFNRETISRYLKKMGLIK
jgi:hypothetical protein